MAFWNDSFIEKRRAEWMNAIYSVQAQVNGVYYPGEIQKKEIDGDTVVIDVVFSSLGTGTVTITAVQIIDVDGQIAATQAENIQKSGTQGVIFQFEFPIREEATN